MAQLLVRNIEDAVVKKLRGQAAEQGISVEEAHRRVLRAALGENAAPPKDNLLHYLRSIPADDGIEFERAKDLPREVSF